MIPEWQKAPLADGNEPPAREEGPPAVGQPETPPSAAGPVSGAPDASLRAERGSVSDPNVPHGTENRPVEEEGLYGGGTFERPRPEPVTDSQPPRPRNFLNHVVDQLNERSKASGQRHRIDADNAILHGVDADAVYVDPKAKYPVVKAHLQRVFSTNKAPLRSNAKPVTLHMIDDLGDRFDPKDFGLHTEGRVEPEHIGQLLSDSIRGHEEAFDRSDPNYERHFDWMSATMRRKSSPRATATAGTRCPTKSLPGSTPKRAAMRGSTTYSIMC
jgi:hypothetical protein